MRYLFAFIMIAFCTNAFSQVVSAPQEDTAVKFHPVRSVKKFADSIRKIIVQDTAKFKKADIMVTSKGRRNTNSYSPLFFINMLYQYKLDIVSGKDALAFMNEILVPARIESVTLMDEQQSLKIFGANGKNGAVLIQLKDVKKVNLEVAGFKFDKSVGNNFSTP